jgi:isopenicillin N synthase-like dioxygenase
MSEFSLPILDLRDFNNEATRFKFVQQLAKAFHELGFFAVINTDNGPQDASSIDAGYAAAQAFFAAPIERKNECLAPESHGERGYVHSEIAQGQTKKDHKEFFHLGESANKWPQWMDFEGPATKMLATVNETRRKLERAISLAMGEKETFLSEMTAPPAGKSLMRCLHYFPNCSSDAIWAAAHTDIGMFTLLPRSTEEGLQVQAPDGRWIPVRVPPNAFVVNCGDKLQNMVNGFFRSSVHRVVAPADPSKERYSIVFFIHPGDDDRMDPRPHMVAATGGKPRFPAGTSLELLHHRLMELGLAPRKDTEFFGRVAKLVADGVAAPPVQRTYDLWRDIQKKQAASGTQGQAKL